MYFYENICSHKESLFRSKTWEDSVQDTNFKSLMYFLHTVFQKCCIISHSYKQCRKVLTSLYSAVNYSLKFCQFSRWKWHIIVFFISVFLIMARQTFFMCMRCAYFSSHKMALPFYRWEKWGFWLQRWESKRAKMWCAWTLLRGERIDMILYYSAHVLVPFLSYY